MANINQAPAMSRGDRFYLVQYGFQLMKYEPEAYKKVAGLIVGLIGMPIFPLQIAISMINHAAFGSKPNHPQGTSSE